jgi:hypothetical protein
MITSYLPIIDLKLKDVDNTQNYDCIFSYYYLLLLFSYYEMGRPCGTNGGEEERL